MSPVRMINGADEGRDFLLRSRQLEQGDLPESIRQSIRERFGEDLSAMGVVERIIERVRADGDQALLHFNKLIDNVELDRLQVTPAEFEAARDQVPADVYRAMQFSRERIELFHTQQLRTSWINFDSDGALGQIIRPLDRVGIYTPAGRAPYPSSLLMTAVPAIVAGVPDVIVCVPAGPDGNVAPIILAAAEIAGVTRVYKVGGAQAIAAMAYGTESIPKVDKILGPGNIFVVLAKKRVYGDVDIDQLPGPTETMLVADESADPELCAADLLAQAEHDPMASAILITTSTILAEQVRDEIESQLGSLEREEVARQSLDGTGAIIVVDTIDEQFDLANTYAPEHLCLLVSDPWSHIDRVKHAGGIFVGENSPEVVGDYTAGPSHVMPTGQTARFSSPINVEEFIKIISLVGINKRGLGRIGPAAATFARAEGLTAHAKAVERRLNNQ
ncbi:MAG: histidinol dehydrogenase [Sphaerobacteraceae bacterium]|nr:MAG: histidinol dehydrogenase [Sphaerobacteraceae bacterium]